MPERKMSPKDIRQWVRDHTHPCPSCGAAVVIEGGGDAEYARLWFRFAELVRDGRAYLKLVGPEDAEALLRERLGEISVLAGGTTIGGRNR